MLYIIVKNYFTDSQNTLTNFDQYVKMFDVCFTLVDSVKCIAHVHFLEQKKYSALYFHIDKRVKGVCSSCTVRVQYLMCLCKETIILYAVPTSSS